ncbi:DUF1771-domain-containing protein [Xylariaceae sp. AK1471]|nr:DUF1771-domain-containing protein [Xylariaceae sp. AK1471]
MSGGIELEQRYGERSRERIGGRDFNHDPSAADEAKFQAWREQAEKEWAKKRDCMQRAHEAYERGDGATAKQLSNEGKRHAAEAAGLDKKASDFIFVVNNSKYTSGDTIDLHGQQVDEAVSILQERIHEDRQRNQTHLHVIVGKGNHSVGHIQRLKPAVEDLCRDLGLQYKTEENAGRVYVNLQGGDVTHMPPLPPQPATQHGGYDDQPHGGYPQHQQQHQQQHHQQHQQQHHQQQQHHPSQQQQHYNGQNQEPYVQAEKLLTKLVNKYCCAVM